MQVERGKIRGEFLGQHRKRLGNRVDRGGVLPRMIVKRRSLFDDRVNVGNGDQDLGGPVGHGFGNGKLVQIARIIVVDGAPEKVPEITRRFPQLASPARGFRRVRRAPGAENLEPVLFRASPDGQFFAGSSGAVRRVYPS
jgi:hypothetical protein